ncbi:MAG TPA: hypothetical protein VM076_13725 [Gemmatimonadaceae bacterium]|nr:hypothetical protein [Gemmatimonadaceae bacterium]
MIARADRPARPGHDNRSALMSVAKITEHRVLMKVSFVLND